MAPRTTRSRTNKKPVATIRRKARKAPIAPLSTVDLQKQLDQRTRERDEALEQQKLTSEVLRAISDSPTDSASTLGAIAESIARLLDVPDAEILRLDGNRLTSVAKYGSAAQWPLGTTRILNRDWVTGRAIVDRKVVHVADLQAEDRAFPEGTAYARQFGHRTTLAVPLLREGSAIGAILIRRMFVKPFTPKQIQLVTNFAAQAVIAIENTRLLNELRESLQQQTATAEVLKVISRSTFNLQAVLDTLVESATRLCAAQDGFIFLPDGEVFHPAARFGFTPEHHELVEAKPLRIDRGTVSGRAAVEGRVVHVSDVLADPDYARPDVQKIAGFRAALGVPLLRQGKVIGVIFLSRTKPQPFSDRQIELVSTFADQAVIAMENARLLNELRERTSDLTEALDQQTATSDVLRVISSSPGELEPVFQAMLVNATRICEAKFGILFLFEPGGKFRAAAMHGVPPAFAEFWQRGSRVPGPRTALARVAASKRAVHLIDVKADSAYVDGEQILVAAVELGGFRTFVNVPMLKDDELIGVFAIYRQKVHPFTDKQIELLQNFAAQAVIAIENARLLNELRESLQQQTATSEILDVISNSPTDSQPAFEAIVRSGLKLFPDAAIMIALPDGNVVKDAAVADADPAGAAALRARFPLPLSREFITSAAILDRREIDLGDVRDAPPELAAGARNFLVSGYRAITVMPMMRGDTAIGTVNVMRREPMQVSEKQRDLLRTFANQAVIAIENTRLFGELRQRTSDLTESLEQQTATSEVLKVISNSVSDLQAVFETMAENAVRLCEAERGYIFRFDGKLLRAVAAYNVGPENWEYVSQNPIAPGRQTVSARVALERRTVQVADVQADSEYRYVALDVKPIHSVLAVPILKGDELVGTITIYRLEIKPFTDKQIALVETFAAQAVIAIENTRLLTELRESLQQQTATADVLKAISRSTFDLQTVLDTLVESAGRLCEADHAWLFRREGELFHFAASFGLSAEEHMRIRDYLKTRDVRAERGSVTGRCALEGKVIHVADVLADPEYTWHGAQKLGGYRAGLGAPLLREGNVIGVIFLMKKIPRPFTEKQIELVTTFADQAVIAIENARLLNELRESLEQQTATAQVLKVISSSPGELEPVFNALLANAIRICEARFGNLLLFEGTAFRAVAVQGEDRYKEYLQRNPVVDLLENRGVPLDRVAETKQVVHVPDLRTDQSYVAKREAIVRLVELGGIRSLVGVPMLKEGKLIGSINLYREEVRPFTEKQIELVQNFAAQAVVAIENVRLLNELRQSLEQQTATVDVLRVISNSPTDVQPVFDSIAESAVRLCGGQFSFVIRFDGKVMNFASCFGLNPEGLDVFRGLFPLAASNDTVSGRAILERAVVEISDVEADPAYGMQSQRLARTVNYRSIVGVPLLHDGNPIGAVAVARANAGSFPERQIALLQAFADQAVIAIRNVRLFDEVQARTEELTESLDQQTATAEVLKVISRSAFDLQPVFETMAENAVKLCEAERAFIFRFDGEQMRAVATYNVGPEIRQFVDQNPIIPGRHSVSARAALERRTVQVPDVQTDPEYAYAARDSELIRTVLAVPMLKGDDLVGTITIYRLEAKPFTDKQVALMETFAAQAVIAIENTRLLTELRESLQQQTATADVLKAISRSTFDLNTVLRTLVEAAARLCEADQGTIAREQDGAFVRVATYGFSTEFTEIVTHMTVERDRGSGTGRALLEGRTIHIPDVESDPDYTFSKAKELGGFRTVLAVPMLRDGAAIGVFALTRVNVRPFTDKQIELVTTFADQAAIAIENVRLFESEEARTRELAKSLEELRTAQDRLVQTQKLASLGQLTAGIAHEIKNPLNFVNNFSGVSGELLDELNGIIGRVTLDEKIGSEIGELLDTLRGNLEKIVQHGKRADSIVKNMLLHSREGSGEHRPVDINLVLEESLNLAYHGARAERQGFNITLERSFDPSAGEVDLFPQEITRVFLNLISNGFYAANKRKLETRDESYEPTLIAATKNLGDRVEIRIRDNGTGISPHVQERMFNPFFTTKPAGEGTGLGLSLSHDIVVKQHAGVIEVESRPGEFTEFRIILPRTAAFIAKTGGQA